MNKNNYVIFLIIISVLFAHIMIASTKLAQLEVNVIIIDKSEIEDGPGGQQWSTSQLRVATRRRVTVLVLKVKINTPAGPRPKWEGSLGLNMPVRTARGPARDSEDMLIHLASRYIGLGEWLLKTDFPATPHRRPPE